MLASSWNARDLWGESVLLFDYNRCDALSLIYYERYRSHGEATLEYFTPVMRTRSQILSTNPWTDMTLNYKMDVGKRWIFFLTDFL